MKVCHITSVHPAFDTRIFVKECRSLADAGYDVTLIAPGEHDQVKDNVRIRHIQRRTNRLNRFLFSSLDVLKKAWKEDADIYHFHDPELAFVGLILKLRGRKVIKDAHENVPAQIKDKDYLPTFFRYPLSEIARVFEKVTSYLFDFTIVDYKSEAYTIYKNKNVAAIHNYPVLKEFDRDPSTPNYQDRPENVTYVGAISTIRGLYEMCDSLTYLNSQSPITLNIAGSLNAEQEHYITRHPQKNRIITHGFLSREDVVGLLGKSRVGLVLLHDKENMRQTFVVKMYEYMAAGIPLLISHFPMWKDFVESHDCGLTVDPYNTEEIAGLMSWLIDNPEQAEQMGQNGRRAVADKYNWEEESQHLLAIYRDLSIK